MPSKGCGDLGNWYSLCIHWILQDMSGCGVMNNSQFWSWVDHWEGWDFMQEEHEAELELAEWCDETLWMICLICGSPVEGCICENIEDATPTPPPSEGQQHPSQ